MVCGRRGGSAGVVEIHYDSPNEIASFLRERNLWLKKRFGQNFLVNPGVRKRLVDLLHLTGEENVWEIGPGIGSLTVYLDEKADRLTVFEIDYGLIQVLNELFPELTVVPGDVVDTWPGIYEKEGLPDRVFGNLPYSSGAAIILSFIERGFAPERMVFTVQKEQAERMIAAPGSRAYSSFSVLCTAFYHLEVAGDIKPGSFFPRPEVTSRIVVLTPNRELTIRHKDVFLTLTRDLFRQKRKTIRNNLESGNLATIAGKGLLFSALEGCSLDLSVRGEELSVHTIAECADEIGRKLNEKANG